LKNRKIIFQKDLTMQNIAVYLHYNSAVKLHTDAAGKKMTLDVKFIENAESFGIRMVHERVTMKMIRRFVNRLKNRDFESKEMAIASLVYSAGKHRELRASFYGEMMTVLKQESFEDSWIWLESVLSYHCLYGGDQS
jgi:capsule polysaccharide export protein KpsE/RkpR